MKSSGSKAGACKRGVSVIIAAAGRAERFGRDKLLAPFYGRSLIYSSVAAFANRNDIDEIIAAVSAENENEIKAALADFTVTYVTGGGTRGESVKNALAAVNYDKVLIHDGARPFVSDALISRCLSDLNKHRSAVPALPAPDTAAYASEDGAILRYTERQNLYNIQTPQGFFTDDIRAAYERADKAYTDDGAVYAAAGFTPYITEGEAVNKKITVPADLDALRFRTGCAFDIHRLTPGRKFILGGLTIPYEKGLLGHSDADVLLHALSGAILNALSLKDIGTYFPDTDPQNKDLASGVLLKAALSEMKTRGYALGNVSLTLIAERPKLKPHIDAIRENLSRLLSLPAARIGLAATTMEKLGSIGAEKAVACIANVLLVK